MDYPLLLGILIGALIVFFAGEGHFYDETDSEDWHYSAEQDV